MYFVQVEVCAAFTHTGADNVLLHQQRQTKELYMSQNGSFLCVFRLFMDVSLSLRLVYTD